MASSEIESTTGLATTQKTMAQNENPVIDVFSACAYGDLEKLQRFVQEEGASVLVPDANGYFPLQWACLNNFPKVARYFIEHGGNVNATENMKQSALHWAAVHGSIACADLLIDFNARVEAADINGYRLLCIMPSTMFRIMMAGPLFTGQHTRDILTQSDCFLLEMHPRKDKIKMVVPLCIGLL